MIRSFLNRSPQYDESNYIAPSAEVIGDVSLGRGTSVWYNVTIRGDVNWIRIGEESNVQDNAVIHVTNRTAPTEVGNRVSIAHGAILHGCTVEDNVLVGIRATILDHAVIGRDCIVGAHALVTGRIKIPPRSLVLGMPARVVRPLTDEEVASIANNAKKYLRYSAIYRGAEKPEVNPFYEPRAS